MHGAVRQRRRWCELLEPARRGHRGRASDVSRPRGPAAVADRRRRRLPDARASCSRTSSPLLADHAPSRARSTRWPTARRRPGRQGRRHRGPRLHPRRAGRLPPRGRLRAGAQARQAARRHARDVVRPRVRLERPAGAPRRRRSRGTGCWSSTTCSPPAAPAAAARLVRGRPAPSSSGSPCCSSWGPRRAPRAGGRVPRHQHPRPGRAVVARRSHPDVPDTGALLWSSDGHTLELHPKRRESPVASDGRPVTTKPVGRAPDRALSSDPELS